jgi:hypothetical protein
MGQAGQDDGMKKLLVTARVQLSAEAVQTVEGSLQYIQNVAAMLTVDKEDEAIVDALIAKRTSGLAIRPLSIPLPEYDPSRAGQMF